MTVKKFMRAFDALSSEGQQRALSAFGPLCCTEFMGNHERMQRLLSWCARRLPQQKMRNKLDRIMAEFSKRNFSQENPRGSV